MKNLLIPFVIFLYACSTIANYSETAYFQTTSLKAEVLLLMSKATEPASKHQKEINNVKISLEKVYEYAKGRPNNELSTKQWWIVKNPDGHSLGGFLTLWEKKPLTPMFIKEAKILVTLQFDELIALESSKKKSTLN